jgi:hypothetical protein
LQSSLIGNVARDAQVDCDAIFDRIFGASEAPEDEEAALVMNCFGTLRKPSFKLWKGEVVLVNFVSIEAKSCQPCQLRLFFSSVRSVPDSLTLKALKCRIDFLNILVMKLQGVRLSILEISP